MEAMEKYIESIFEKQTEQLMKDLIFSYAKENGEDISNIDKIVADQEEFCTVDPWDCLRYSRGQIREMLNKL